MQHRSFAPLTAAVLMASRSDPPARQGATDSAHELVRRLSSRYLLVLLAVATLVAADQALLQPLLVRMNAFAPAINMAGRQRMLSQRIAKSAFAMHAASDARARSRYHTELKSALAEWCGAHEALKHGGAELNVRRIDSPAIQQAWNDLAPHYEALEQAAERLAADSQSSGDAKPLAAGSRAALAALIQHEGPFLNAMDHLVDRMEDQAAAELRRLRALALTVALAIVGLVLGLGHLVVRPATWAIRNQVEQLEERVAERTRQLDTTLVSLRHEIEERERTESHSRTIAAQLAHAGRVESVGRLAAGLAHELNQPLGAIANYADACDATLAGSWTDDRRSRLQRYLREMQQASLRAGAIVRRIRNFVRPGPGNAAPFDMAALVQEVVGLCRPELARREVDLQLDLPARQIVLSVDSIQIQQVLVNLVQNALQAMQEVPAERRRLVLRMAATDEGLQIDVVDSGPGLAGADPELLFAPFHTTKADGLGIGLSICRSIVEQHQGTIWARSPRSGGAQFSFVLPLTAEHATEPVR